MPKNYWMVVQSQENFEISRRMGFELHGLGRRYRRRAQRMEPDDRVLFYVSGLRKWDRGRVDRVPMLRGPQPGLEVPQPVTRTFPYRVKLEPYIVLDEEDYIDGLLLGPRLDYVKRWPPGGVAAGLHGCPAPSTAEGLPPDRGRDEEGV